MSQLSADTKDALARDMPGEAHCRAALLGGLTIYGAKRGTFVTHRNAVARLFRSLVRRVENASARITSTSGSRIAHAPAYSVPLIETTGSLPRKPARKCDRIMEARAAFLACGSLAAGARGYHLEFVLADSARAQRLALMLRTIGRPPKSALRKRRVILYYKDFDAIADVLTTIGAFGALLHLENVRAMRETKNRIHRLVNTEAANLERAAGAAAGQVVVIRYLADAYGLQNLSPPLREIAEMRMAHPEETLAELGRRCNPAIGKPTANSRLCALAKLARGVKADPSQRTSRKVARRGAR